MNRTLSVLLLWIATACSPALKMPGPPGVVGRAAPPRPALPATQAPPSQIALVTAPATVSAPPISSRGDDLAAAASHYLSHTPRGFRNDCSGFVCAVASRAGLDMEGNTRGLWELASGNGWIHRRKIPQVGDIAFFDQTYDRNRNGRLDDELTHVAVVIEVELDGTIVLAHAGTSRGRTTLRMNLDQPGTHRDVTGRELNGYLRAQRKSDPKRTRYLAGELWRAFATIDESEGQLAAGSSGS